MPLSAAIGTPGKSTPPSAAPPLRMGGLAGNIAVALNASPTHASAPLMVNFSATASTNSTPSSFTFNWSFSDGSAPVVDTEPASAGTAVGKVNHTFTSQGKFNVAVLVTDNLGDPPSTANVSIGVSPPLVVTPSVTPSAVSVGRPVVITFNASGGVAPYHVAWTAEPSDCYAGAANLTCVPPSPGNYSVRMTVSDSTVDHTSQVVYFVVSPRLSVSAGYQSYYFCSGTVGTAIYNLTAIAGGGSPPFNYTWTIGNGIPDAYGPVVSLPLPLGEAFAVSVRIVDASNAQTTASVSFTTSFPSCGSVPEPIYTPPRDLLVGGVVAAALIVAVLAYLVWRTTKPRPPPAPWRARVPAGAARPPGDEAPTPAGPAAAPPEKPPT
ncbi:MAG: PKD domain-containing protein [Thermoplasmata archaeon]|nr:PKD domain-containing protein [Thermoplasmata archaeon]